MIGGDKVKKGTIIGLVILGVVLLLGLLFLLGYLQFGKHIKIFNVFLCAGGYIISIIILAIVSLKDKDCKNENSRERQSNKPD